jgi:hypothetical protein
MDPTVIQSRQRRPFNADLASGCKSNNYIIAAMILFHLVMDFSDASGFPRGILNYLFYPELIPIY